MNERIVYSQYQKKEKIKQNKDLNSLDLTF